MDKFIMTSVTGNKIGFVELNIIKDDNKKPIEENVIFQKKIRFKKTDEKKPRGFSVFRLIDSQPGSRHGEYQAETSTEYRYYMQWVGREYIGHKSFLKMKVWETGCNEPYFLFFENLTDTKSKFRQKLPMGSIPETEFEFMRIRHNSDEVMKKRRREIRRAEIRKRRLSQ